MSKIYDDLTDKLTVIYSLSYARITFAATYRCFSRNFIIGLSARLTCKGTRGAHLARALGDTFRGAHVSVQLVSHDTGREKSACSGQAGLSVTAAAARSRRRRCDWLSLVAHRIAALDGWTRQSMSVENTWPTQERFDLP